MKLQTFRRELNREYERLGEGIHRVVYKIGPKCVMKVAMHLGGARANLAEAHAWNKIKETRDKKVIQLFAPVASVGEVGEYLVMPRAEVLYEGDEDEDNEDFYEAEASAMLGRLARNGVLCKDIHEGNIGRLGKRWVVIDYGFGVKCRIRPTKKVAP